jgi:hypothetical protein
MPLGRPCRDFCRRRNWRTWRRGVSSERKQKRRTARDPSTRLRPQALTPRRARRAWYSGRAFRRGGRGRGAAVKGRITRSGVDSTEGRFSKRPPLQSAVGNRRSSCTCKRRRGPRRRSSSATAVWRRSPTQRGSAEKVTPQAWPGAQRRVRRAGARLRAARRANPVRRSVFHQQVFEYSYGGRLYTRLLIPTGSAASVV